MGTLENAKRVVLGNLCNGAKVVAPQLLINEEPKDKAQVVAHTLRHLLLQHSEERTWLNKKVSCYYIKSNSCLLLMNIYKHVVGQD